MRKAKAITLAIVAHLVKFAALPLLIAGHALNECSEWIHDKACE